VNAVSSFAFLIAGIAVMTWARRTDGHERTLRTVFGVAMIATGVGSFLFHGFDSSVAQFLHDITFLVTIWILAVINVTEMQRRSRYFGWGVVGVGALVFSVALLIGPQITNILTVVVSAALVGADIVLHRRGSVRTMWYWAALVAMLLAIAAFLLGRSSGPLCDPASIFQGHAAWHLLAAIAVTSYFVATSDARIQSQAGSP
jgi:predicted membrane channel-forming protein YqfA (hemolysin III family)